MTPLLAMPPQLLLLARPPRVSSNGRPAEEGAESNPKSCIEESPTPSRRAASTSPPPSPAAAARPPPPPPPLPPRAPPPPRRPRQAPPPLALLLLSLLDVAALAPPGAVSARRAAGVASTFGETGQSLRRGLLGADPSAARRGSGGAETGGGRDSSGCAMSSRAGGVAAVTLVVRGSHSSLPRFIHTEGMWHTVTHCDTLPSSRLHVVERGPVVQRRGVRAARVGLGEPLHSAHRTVYVCVREGGTWHPNRSETRHERRRATRRDETRRDGSTGKPARGERRERDGSAKRRANEGSRFVCSSKGINRTRCRSPRRRPREVS